MHSKTELRRRMADVLSKLSEENKQLQSRVVLEKVIAHPKYKQAKNLSLYLSTSQEVDTIQLLRHALEVDKKACYIPYIPKNANILINRCKSEPRMRMIELKSMKSYDEFPLNRFGIKEPNEEFVSQHNCLSAQDKLDLVIVPGVAFAKDGRRLGHGKGYYDEFFFYFSKNSSINKQPYALGLALREQIVDDPLAVAEHDFVLDEILTAD